MKPSVLYLSYTGLLEPLGRSQVQAYLQRLSEHHDITLVTFEKPGDLADAAAMQAMHDLCCEHSIKWIPRRYHHRPRLLATLYDLAVITAFAVRHGRCGEAQLVHCRGYVTALGAWLAGRITAVPFVFDMRALWIDEMVLAGRLRHGSLLERLLRLAERRLLRDAAAVVSLTQAAVDYLKARDPALEQQHFIVIPTCADVERFSRAAGETSGGDPLVLGSLGTLASGWVPIETLVALYAELLSRRPDTRLLVLTRDDPDLLLSELAAQRVPTDGVSVAACDPSEVPQRLRSVTVGVALFRGTGIGKLGSMPTRIGELLAAGIPVIGNHGVGDVAEILSRHRVGVVLGQEARDEARDAIDQVLELLADPDVNARCVAVARDYFSVERGVSLYSQIWNQVTSLETPIPVQESGSSQ